MPAHARGLPFALVLVAAFAAPLAAQARTTVVLATHEPMLETALRAALEPWHVAVIVLDDGGPGASMPSSADRGAAIARAHGAAAVTWISRDESGAVALWLYDRDSGQVIARALPIAPPFDEATADSVALSIKTLLRHSSAAPTAERVVDPPAPSELRLEIGLGARALTTSIREAEPRAELGASYWPRGTESIVGVSLSARGGTGVAVHAGPLFGRWNSFDLHLGLRLRATPAPLIDFVFGMELGASVSWLDATITTDGTRTTPVSVDPSSYVWLELGLRPLSLLRISVRLGVFAAMRTRTYLVRGERLLSTEPISPFAELVFELPLDGGRVDSP